MKIRDLLADQKYQQKKVIEKILCHHTGLTKEALILNYDTDIDTDTLSKIDHDYELYTIHDKPLEYIFGYVEFFKRKFKIDGRSLIPRPETEYMIEAVNEHISNSQLTVHNSQLNSDEHINGFTGIENPKSKIQNRLLDVGTGTGVLGLSVLLDNPGYFDQAFLSEYYETTLSLAKENYEHYKSELGTKTAIQVIQANLVDFLLKDHLSISNGELRIVLVANLPYIPDEVFDTQTEDNVRKWEPRPAFVGGYDGLDFYREMFAQLFAMSFQTGSGIQLDAESSSSGLKSGVLNCTMFLEMMTRQVDILRKEFGDKIDFEEIKTFHFNIRIVKGILK